MTHSQPSTGRPLSIGAFAGALLGLIAAIPALPSVVRGIALFGFVLVGPGAAIMTWTPTLPQYATAVLVPVVGISIIAVVAGTASMVGVWQPRLTLLVLAVATFFAAIAADRRRGREVSQ